MTGESSKLSLAIIFCRDLINQTPHRQQQHEKEELTLQRIFIFHNSSSKLPFLSNKITTSTIVQYWRIKFVVTFLSRFLDSRVGLSNYRYYQSCSPGSEDSKLILHYSVALFLSILEGYNWLQLVTI